LEIVDVLVTFYAVIHLEVVGVLLRKVITEEKDHVPDSVH
jgi:hypothetical protein